MALSAFMILWFIGAVCFWQAEKATGGQNWSYFKAIYFTYVAQLTIGYGDFEPQANSAKPTFVFWSLIALPTLTVLIGAHVPSFLRFATSMSKKSRPKETLKDVLTEKDQPDARGISQNTFGQLAAEKIEDAYRPFTMLRAAQTVLTRLGEEPAWQYMYQEWTWLMKLLGEDEETKEGHRIIGQPLPNGIEVCPADRPASVALDGPSFA
ncbi:Uu.00g135160.m01.CDS01 [Anthostomella pinea]|uniref:Uu.00g135160.m01.CDS01 n=1 Tax=Anthostomella pinea TaxID=933095 RepID=A0AAI8YIH0_9PEZI|nr:Uu.00g135160.m01.CDS01 [Anthostomella pinea]